jgi:hypothetical protein
MGWIAFGLFVFGWVSALFSGIVLFGEFAAEAAPTWLWMKRVINQLI